MLGRRDLAQHFFVSAYLTAAMGAGPAEAAGMAKEMLDAQGGSGFSFADLAADRAGIHFASAVLEKKVSLPLLGQGFAVVAAMPPIEGLPEGLTSDELAVRFGLQSDQRFRQQLQVIDQRIHSLPLYRGREVLSR